MSPTPQGGVRKRRACDECRTRKLACSKEPDGCARCRREGIKCHYSPQKPMGRPRKRPLKAADTHVPTTDVPRERTGPLVVPPQDSLLDSAMDLDMAFLGMDDDKVNFIDLLAPEPDGVNPFLSPMLQYPNGVEQSSIWQMDSEHLLSIGSGTLADQAPMKGGQSYEQTEQPGLPETSDQTPGLMSTATDSPRHEPRTDSPVHEPTSEPENPDLTCSCLASLYLAMDSLQRLPKDTGDAMRAARTAAKTAYDTILCPACAQPPIETVTNPPIKSTQNMLLLGALLPSIADAYKRILRMVDDEVGKATRDRRKMTFRLFGYGGLWGPLTSHADCVSDKYASQEMEPHQWRQTVRALLRLDVYGVSPIVSGSRQGGCVAITHPGLKELIGMLEKRSRQRHELVDRMVASGALSFDGYDDYAPLDSGVRPTCLRIVDLAKKSLDDLVIP